MHYVIVTCGTLEEQETRTVRFCEEVPFVHPTLEQPLPESDSYDSLSPAVITNWSTVSSRHFNFHMFDVFHTISLVTCAMPFCNNVWPSPNLNVVLFLATYSLSTASMLRRRIFDKCKSQWQTHDALLP